MMDKIIAFATAIWLLLAILVGFICLVIAIGMIAVMITAFIDKVVGWFRGESDER